MVFACVFEDQEKAGPAMLEFLNAVLTHVGEEHITEIIDMKSEYSLMGESSDQKYFRLDVKVRADSGRIFDVEVQIEKDYMNERGLLYGVRLSLDELKAGVAYKDMSKTRVINLLDFYIDDEHKDIVEPVALMYVNKPNKAVTDKFMMYHIQLPAFRKQFKNIKDVKKGDRLGKVNLRNYTTIHISKVREETKDLLLKAQRM